MEEVIGSGGYNPVRDRSGITARVIEGGTACVGAAIE
jgi:MOSC domain-containing protein YiiM